MGPKRTAEFPGESFNECEARLAAIGASREAGDYAQIAKAAQTIVSAAGNTGAQPTSRLARTLKEQIRHGEIEGCNQAIADLRISPSAASVATATWIELREAAVGPA
jgi:hypothetical protein